MKAKKITIKGKVHDVGSRLFLLNEAESLFIENFDAGNVVVNGDKNDPRQSKGEGRDG